jgi:predicted DNA-binding protein
MKIIGKLVNVRLPESEYSQVDDLAAAQRRSKATLLREIIAGYVANPDDLAAEFTERIHRAIRLREAKSPEGKVQVCVTLPLYQIDTLKLLSNQTGASIDGLVSLMVVGHLLRCRKAGEAMTFNDYFEQLQQKQMKRIVDRILAEEQEQEQGGLTNFD